MSNLKNLTKALLEFRKERKWEQFHNPKDQAISIALEASEFLEHFQWKNPKEVTEYVKRHKEELSEELADILCYLLMTSHDLQIDIVKAAEEKLAKSKKKYPIEKAKGVHTKYNKF